MQQQPGKRNFKVIEGTSSSQHTFEEEEKQQYVIHINSVLVGDALVGQRIPVSPDTNELFQAVQDGLLLSQLINSIEPGTIDERVLNIAGTMNQFEKIENNNIVIGSAQALGCRIVNIGPYDLLEGREHLVLGLVWQLIKRGLLQKVSLNHHPEIVALLEQGETIEMLFRLPAEQVLMRWANHHLAKTGCTKRVSNMDSSLQDSECYAHLLAQLAPGLCSTACLSSDSLAERAEAVLAGAEKIGCRKYLTARAIVEGNPRLNLAFLANLFNEKPELHELAQEDKGRIDEMVFSLQDNREARMLCLWLSSISSYVVADLFVDLRDGIVLLQAFDIIVPGAVEWTRANTQRPVGLFRALENTNYVIELARRFQLSVVGTQGGDITDGAKTLTLGLVWQMMRLHLSRTLARLSSAKQGLVGDAELVEMANALVERAGKTARLCSFKDAVLQKGAFFVDMLDSIRPGVVDYALVLQGVTDDEKRQNGLYAISLARKLGAVLFLLPEDIVEARPKIMATFVASLLELSSRAAPGVQANTYTRE